MKRPLLLFFFLSFLFIRAQNSEEIASIDDYYIPVYKDLLDKQTLVDRDYANDIDFKWLQHQIISSKNNNTGNDSENNEFDSFVLIGQLKELNKGTPFKVIHKPTLERYIRVFLRSRKETLARLMERSRYYFPIFEEYLDKYDLPLEIKYLAVIESALKPHSKSKTGARGLWQFTYATGKHFGLEINSFVDERYDPVKSTEAACKFLSRLYQMFGDWDLALAAYNSGPGNVTKAIRRSGGNTNYWEIRKYLPLETRGYLPAFYATLYLFEYSDFHHINPKDSGLTYYETDTVQINEQVSLKKISSLLELPEDFLKILNPQYKRGIIPGKTEKSYSLVIPKNKIACFIDKEKELYTQTTIEKKTKTIPVSAVNSYEVQKGDHLKKIASKFNISIEQLKTWNGLETNYLIDGMCLVISDKNRSKEKLNSIYTVQKGVSFFKISKGEVSRILSTNFGVIP